MSDKELSDYIKTIDPKFNSNLEKGTIEMTNEYYNLLEEYIARLNDKKDLYKSVLDKIKEYIENTDDFDIEIFDENSGGCLGTDLSKGAKHILEIIEETK